MRRLAEAIAVAALLHGGPAGIAAGQGPAPLRLGVVSFYNPRTMYQKYQPLIDYLTARSGTRWELAVSGSYESTVDSLCKGRITAAYLGPLTYVRAQERCGASPVVKLLTRGRATFQSLVVVRADSAIQRLEDLRGKSFGFGSPLSTSSHAAPRAMLQEAGVRPGVDVRCRYYMHHESAARAVLMGEVDAAGVRDIVGDEFTRRGLRILGRSGPLPNFPFVMGPRVPASVAREMVRVLVTVPETDAAARAAISRWDEELAGGFARAEPAEFEPVRRLGDRVFGRGWTALPERALECRGGER